ncbi:MAG: ABC transporter permease [Alphaproteobacteria bacterium]|nr:ABC transporter permease [Alphaproteobacteria bacterium]
MDQTLTRPPLDASHSGALAPRAYGSVNWIGLWTLCLRETRRFWKVGMQTLFAPVVSSILMLFVFKLAIPGGAALPGGLDFASFLTPGIVMMAVLTNAFANTSSSLIIAKVQGNSVDFLMPPLSPIELTLGFLSGSVTRGVLVGLVTYVSVWAMQITPFNVEHVWAIAYYAIIGSLFMGAVGLLGGIWADKFDHMAAVQNFVIAPLTMLSGTFYPLSRLGDPFESISHANPFFHLIDGFRYGFTGQHEGDLAFGAIYVLAITLALCALCWRLLRSGYKLKA